MVYKIGSTADLANIAITVNEALQVIRHYAEILTTEYGADRNVDTDNGGYILYATPNTSYDEIKSLFDYTQYLAESVQISGNVCATVYILSNDYGVVIVMSANDTPPEILKEINNTTED